MTVFNDDCVKVMDNFKDLCPWEGGGRSHYNISTI